MSLAVLDEAKRRTADVRAFEGTSPAGQPLNIDQERIAEARRRMGRPGPTPPPAGMDPNWANDPNQVAANLGRQGYAPGYDSNDKGSFERNYNSLLNNLSPDQLLKRYSTAETSQYGTGLDRANYQAYNSFKSLIGRDPTASELAQAIPAFQGGATTGNAWLASFKQAYDKNPANLAAGAGKYSNQINQVFQSQLGRAATGDEITHFGSYLGSGNLDAYGLQQFLAGTPEYQTQQDTKFRGELGTQLENSDTSYFNRSKQGLLSQFAQNGQTFGNSTALDSALVDLMGQIQQKRSDYMANLTSQQYGGNKQLALSNYGNAMDQYLQNNNYDKTLNQNQMGQYMDRSNNISDYNRQQQDWMNYANSYQNPRNPFGNALSGAAAGAGMGYQMGGPAGAGYGALAGGAYGYLSGR